MPRGDLRMCFCSTCGFVFNSAFDPVLMVYNADYNNTQESSECFKQHLSALKEKLTVESGLKNSTIAEIGCGKGFFLKMLILDESLGNRGFGFDPSYEGEEVMAEGRLTFEKKYFDGNCRGFKADALICRHVIEHIPNPRQFVEEISVALGASPGCRLFFETPCIDWIFDNLTIWDFFYEHCSLFSAESLTILFNHCGYQIKRLEHVFGNQYLWMEAAKSSESTDVSIYTGKTFEKMKKFAAYERGVIARWNKTVQHLKGLGSLAVWGAGAKGVTFVNLLDRRRDLIDLIIDLNPAKHDKYIPGTGHKVVGYEDIAGAGIKNVIVMNPNYIEEIRAMLSKSGVKVNLITEPGEYNENSD
ncbi:MAG: NDP-hexose methyltransferase protein [uncultured bacterium]|nr:MAG: NDP-hexose methyltransferase protein [uncultured bacterium]